MKTVTLSNGLRILLCRRDFVHSASVCFFIGAGPRFETPEQSGVSHFIEHMLFKGTERFSELEIAEKMDEMGGQLNAYTAKEYTCIYAQVLTAHLPEALDLMADMLLHSVFDPEEIGTERGVILEEIGMYEDSPEDLCSDLMYASVYRGSSLSSGIAGTRESVKGLDREKMLDFMAAHYVPERMTVSICGSFDEESAAKQIETLFGGLKNTGNPFAADTPEFCPGIYKKTRRFEQTQLILCGEGLPSGHPDRYAAGVLSSVLGGGSSSRLSHRIRSQLGLAYSVGSYCVSHTGTGFFCVSAGTSHATQMQVLEEALAILREVRENGVTTEELRRTKEQFKSGLLIGLESSSAYASMVGRAQLLENRVTPEDKMIRAIDGLTLDDLHRAAEKLLNLDRMALAVVGKPEKKAVYQEILAQARARYPR